MPLKWTPHLFEKKKQQYNPNSKPKPRGHPLDNELLNPLTDIEIHQIEAIPKQKCRKNFLFHASGNEKHKRCLWEIKQKPLAKQ